MNTVQELHIPIPELRGAIWDLGSCHDYEVGIDGPAGTGKTYGILYYIHNLLWKYPGSKWLVTRMYNTDLSGSAMATYRDDVLHPSEGVHYFGGNKVEPASYRYPNGSRLLVSGLDRASKVKSLEVDGVYINEATECDANRVEFCRMRIRKGKMPFQQLLMDFNPDAPIHHLNLRMNAGTTTRLLSRHEDNPRYWDTKANDWTEEGRRYVLGILEGLTGVRLLRYRWGIWAAAEGAVYTDSWDRKRNVIDRFPIPKSWARYLSVDFGYTNPFCCQWFAEDPDGRLYRYREIYKTKRLVEDHSLDIAIASGWYHLLPRDHDKYRDRPDENADPLPREIICDHDIEDRKTLERHLKLYTTPAKKSISDGIQAVAARFRAMGDGRPRLYFLRGSLVERDPELIAVKKPTCFEEEIDAYVWAENSAGIKEEPVDKDNHAQDCTRYMVAHMDLVPNKVGYVKGFWR